MVAVSSTATFLIRLVFRRTNRIEETPILKSPDPFLILLATASWTAVSFTGGNTALVSVGLGILAAMATVLLTWRIERNYPIPSTPDIGSVGRVTLPIVKGQGRVEFDCTSFYCVCPAKSDNGHDIDLMDIVRVVGKENGTFIVQVV